MLTPFDVWKMSSAFQTARMILSASELGIFEALSSGAKDTKKLARLCRSSVRGMEYILDALAAIGILEKNRGMYRVPKALNAALSPDSEDSILPILRHSSSMWFKWHCLTKVVRTGKPADCLKEMDRDTKDKRVAFIGAMHAIAVGRGIAHYIARDCKVASRRKRLLDIGGASGTYAVAFLNIYPKLKATIFDLPDVIPMAKARIEKTRFAKRIGFCRGDFDSDALPKGHDLALLSAIIHQNGRKENRALYKKIYSALDDGGTLIIRDHVMSDDRTKPPLGAIFAVNMLVATDGGGTYTFKEIREDLASTGFSRIKMIRKGDNMDSLVSAEKRLQT
ncbi:MAG: hypothetical protein COV46_03490 [Deltaproteobacteria bacterium CG11_big_fil_rev_8_21_14_0_20_49_13]|nr:MAG: hypothetical protein COV46_03490 [Deltaproteobacteria bacterium CG11_big_fil_rev_8_21_14_0_20_49_13]